MVEFLGVFRSVKNCMQQLSLRSTYETHTAYEWHKQYFLRVNFNECTNFNPQKMLLLKHVNVWLYFQYIMLYESLVIWWCIKHRSDNAHLFLCLFLSLQIIYPQTSLYLVPFYFISILIKFKCTYRFCTFFFCWLYFSIFTCSFFLLILASLITYSVVSDSIIFQNRCKLVVKWADLNMDSNAYLHWCSN